MANNFFSAGFNPDVVAPEAVNSGELVAIGALKGVAQTDAAQGERVAITTFGVFVFPKTANEAIDAGEEVYIDGGEASAVAGSGGVKVGVAVDDAADTDATVKVFIYPGA